MSGAETEVLARMRLVQGRSVVDRQEFVRSRGQTRLLTVGRDAECDWCIQEAGVAPVHFSLHLDGTGLRIADTHGAGNLRVDGTLVGSDWLRLVGRSRIDFGRAVIAVEAIGGPQEPEGWGTVLVPEPGNVGTPPRRATQLQDFSVQVAASVKVTGSGPPASAEHPHQATVIEVGAQRDYPLAALSHATEVVPHRGWQNHSRHEGIERESPNKAAFEIPGRIPKAVVVLSPVATGATELPVISERPSYRVRGAKPLPGWVQVALGVLAVVGGYVSWLYLLYRL